QLAALIGFNTDASFADPSTPLTGGRNDMALYGKFNAMQLGLSYDVMRRWTGNATSLVAQGASFVPDGRQPVSRRGDGGGRDRPRRERDQHPELFRALRRFAY